MKSTAAPQPPSRPIASAISPIPIASLTISAAMRREVQPTARMIPISRIRSNTAIAIVFVTPIPPMISASSEKIQPAVTIRRLEVSIFTAWPGSVIALMPGKRASSRFATAFGVSPILTITPKRRHLVRPLRDRLHRLRAAARRCGR